MKIKWFSLVRITGLFLVLLYHFFINTFKGGFIGVDVFFTFSGFLITALLIDEYYGHQTIAAKGFFKRRFYRIVPPVFLMLIIIIPLAYLVRDDYRAGLPAQIAAVIGFVSNFFEQFTGASYENLTTPHLFVHTWSLAIEMQFYLIWGLGIWWISKISNSRAAFRQYIFLISSGLFLISFLTMFISSFFATSFSQIYYSSIAHCFPFFIGATLASLTGVRFPGRILKILSQKLGIREILGLFASGLLLLVLLTVTLSFESIWTYIIGFIIASLAAATMILAARLLHDKTSHIKEPASLVFIANTSYCIYLFHWPLYTIFHEKMGQVPAVLLTLVLSFLLASLSYYIIEPLIAGKPVIIQKRRLKTKLVTKWLLNMGSVLAVISLISLLNAPVIGALSKDLLTGSFIQADKKMDTTRLSVNTDKTNKVKEGALIIGDSVTEGAMVKLQELLPDTVVDAAKSRNISSLQEELMPYVASNTLPRTLVIALGTNASSNYKEILKTVIANLPKGRHLVLVTPYIGNPENANYAYSELIASYEKELADKYEYVSVADWHQTATNHPYIWENSDRIHFRSDTQGPELYATTIKEAIEASNSLPVKG